MSDNIRHDNLRAWAHWKRLEKNVHPDDVEFANAITAVLDELQALREVEKAARAWSDCVEQGFAADMRPDIARALLERSLTALDQLRAKQGGGGEK
jgi:hypothetical protein